MNGLVRQIKLGDTAFGISGAAEVLNKPWGFYEFLGVPRNASSDAINKAFRRLSQKLHPDVGGDARVFEDLGGVVEVLLDDGGSLGVEHSKRRQYDVVSGLDSFFTESIKQEGERTKKMSEIVLERMQAERQEAETEHSLGEGLPRFLKLKEQLELAGLPHIQRQIAEQMQDMVIDATRKELPPETHEQVKAMARESQQRFEAQQRQFVQTFNPSSYSSMLLDLSYIGQGSVTFGTYRSDVRIGLVSSSPD